MSFFPFSLGDVGFPLRKCRVWSSKPIGSILPLRCVDFQHPPVVPIAGECLTAHDTQKVESLVGSYNISNTHFRGGPAGGAIPIPNLLLTAYLARARKTRKRNPPSVLWFCLTFQLVFGRSTLSILVGPAQSPAAAPPRAGWAMRQSRSPSQGRKRPSVRQLHRIPHRLFQKLPKTPRILSGVRVPYRPHGG